MTEKWKFKTPGIPDAYFLRGKVPMTKEEIRAVTISKLRLKEDSVVVDIGAGTGSISIEAALICDKGKVIAIERNQEGVELIRKNSVYFGAAMDIQHGNGSACLRQIESMDRCIIGGSGGELEELIGLCYQKLTKEGILVINSITIETLYESIQYLRNSGFSDIDVVSLSVSKGRNVGRYTMMEALNPIYIISGVKV
ncbi:MAG: precorrin-6Y C5,15-methyltransferase (decarboxylating) subunit CbiT [Bacillota bacterium]